MFSAWVQKWINQLAHIGWGGFLALAIGQHFKFKYAMLAVMVFAAAKEGIFDPLTETKAEQGSGWEDFGFWVLGVFAAYAAVVLG